MTPPLQTALAGLLLVLSSSTAALTAGAQEPTRASTSDTRCTGSPLMMQVLGSGGPIAGGGRASTSYLVWRDGRALVLVDAGGGAFLRFGESGARLQDLALLAVSHLHPDHVSDLPALLWLSEVARTQPLPIAGPSGVGAFPAMSDFLARLFDGAHGAFPVLAGTLGQSGQGVRLDVREVSASAAAPVTVLADGDLEIQALPVPHGNVPSLAYRIRVGDRSVVFGSDQNGTDPRFTRFAEGAGVLVLHLAVSSRAPDALARLHATPAVIGRMAQGANPRRVVLSHLMQAPPLAPSPEWFSLSALDASVAVVREHFAGQVEVASDLQCFAIE